MVQITDFFHGDIVRIRNLLFILVLYLDTNIQFRHALYDIFIKVNKHMKVPIDILSVLAWQMLCIILCASLFKIGKKMSVIVGTRERQINLFC